MIYYNIISYHIYIYYMYKRLTHFGFKKQMVFPIRLLPRCSAGLPFGRSSVAKMQGRCATYEAEEDVPHGFRLGCMLCRDVHHVSFGWIQSDSKSDSKLQWYPNRRLHKSRIQSLDCKATVDSMNGWIQSFNKDQ